MVGASVAALSVGLLPLGALPSSAVDSAGAAVDAASDTYVPSQAARSDVEVTVPVRTVSGMRALTGEGGSVNIKVGRSGYIPVAVDTGFTGLLLFPDAMSEKTGGVSISKHASKFTGLGLRGTSSVTGFPGKAKITISGVESVYEVPFLYTKSTSPFFNALRSTGVHGLMGIGLKGDKGFTNPLAAMPGQLGLRWSIHYSRSRSAHSSGAIVLGAAPPAESTMVFHIPRLGQDSYGAQLWNDYAVPACWKFARMAEQCVPTTFDSQFTVLRGLGLAGRGVQTDVDGDTRLGTRVSLRAPGSAYTGWSYLSGQRASVNRTQVFKHGKPAVNTGNAIFFDFTLTYDAINGSLTLSDPVTKAGAHQ